MKRKPTPPLRTIVLQRIGQAVILTVLIVAYVNWQHAHQRAVIADTERHDGVSTAPATISPEKLPPTCRTAEPGVFPGSAIIQKADGTFARTHDLALAFDQAAYDAPDVFPGVTGHDHNVTVIKFCKA